MIYALLFLAAVTTAIFQGSASNSTLIDGEYIVVFHSHVDADRRAFHMTSLKGAEVMHEYSIGTFSGYAAKMDKALTSILMATGDVAYIEPNQRYFALDMDSENYCIQDTDVASWGLTRTNQRHLNLDGTFSFKETSGEDITAYIIDTGIFIEHEDFEGRAVFGVDTADHPPQPVDGNGHGTHVAGTVMGKKYGIAKKATAIAVKVLSTDGFGSTAGVIAGVDWMVKHHKENGKKKSIGNMSLGGGVSAALDAAVNQAVAEGIIVVAAAGNDGWFPWMADACNYSPARATQAITVGSTDPGDARSGFSNYGVCVDIFAPGTDITSAWIGNPTADITISGTSMAAPHVAGVLAQYWSQNTDLTSVQVQKNIKHLASADLLSDIRAGSPNLLLFADCDA